MVIGSFAGKKESSSGIRNTDSCDTVFHIYIFFFLSFQSQALLRQDDTNGRVAEAFTIEMRDMQSEDSTFETNPHPTGRK